MLMRWTILMTIIVKIPIYAVPWYTFKNNTYDDNTDDTDDDNDELPIPINALLIRRKQRT